MEFWTSLPGIVRYPIALGLIAISLLLFFYSGLSFKLCGVIFAAGLLALIIGPSSSDKNGYRF